MKPKHSTGYLTPQASKNKTANRRRSESKDDLNIAKGINDSLFEKLMDCPIKRQLVLKIISSEKDKIEEYKRNQEQGRHVTNCSPLSKVQKRFRCESPTALLRRRALEQQSRLSPISDTHSDDTSSSGSTSCSGPSTGSIDPSPVPFDKLLNGVIAFVEIKNKDEDRSDAAKLRMRSMGATVREKFTKDVTHVVFKDGSFTTYQKAKLMRIHLVSVLWIEAVRSTKTRVSEKKFPALGTEAYDHNVSAICSQMQRDYEDIIRDELRRSMATGTPLPSTKSLIDRRRTIMTPVSSSYQMCSQDFQSSQDREVENILHCRSQSQMLEQELIESRLSREITSDDDSDLGAVIDGSIVNGKRDVRIHSLENRIIINSVDLLGEYIDPNMHSISAREAEISRDSVLTNSTPQKTNLCDSNMDLTTLHRHLIIDDSITDSMKENYTPNLSSNGFYNKRTPKLPSEKNSQTRETPRKSIADLFNIPDEKLYKRHACQLKDIIAVSDNSVNIPKESNKSDSTSEMSSLKLLSDIQIISKNICTNSVDAHDKEIRKAENVVDKSSSTNMSSLHISSTSSRENKAVVCEKEVNNIEKSTSTNMSSLLLKSSSNNNKSIEEKLPAETVKKKSFNSTTDKSFSPLSTSVIKEVIRVLGDSPLVHENVTKRRGKQSIHAGITYNTRRRTLMSGNNTSADSDGEAEDDSEKGINTSGTQKVKNNNYSGKDIAKTESHCRSDEEKSNRRKTSKAKDIHLTSKKTDDNKPTNETPTTHDETKEVKIDSEKGINTSGTKKLKNNSRKDIAKTESYCRSDEEKYNRRKTRSNEKNIHLTSKEIVDNKPTNEETNSSDGRDRRNKMRKLYNPADLVKDIDLDSDEKERESKRTKTKKRKSDKGVFLNPNIITVTPNFLLTSKAKEFMDRNRIDMHTLLNKESEGSETDSGSSKKKKKTVNEKQNSDADEQKGLAEEFSKIKNTSRPRTKVEKTAERIASQVVSRRRSARLSKLPSKKLNLNSSTSSGEDKTPLLNRRSTMEFQTISMLSAKKKLKIDKTKRPSIVCTKLHKDEILVFNQIVKKLGGFVIEDEVSTKTTHLVAGEPKRTINMLRAIAMGCWVLKHEWLLKSLEEGKWLPEEDYEEVDFSPSVQKCRLQRQAFGPSFSMDIFQDCGPIYIAKGSTPRCSDLRELVSLCKGKVVTIPRNASIIVGEYAAKFEGVKCVSEAWVLDCITFNRKLSFKKYFIASGESSPIV